uniref:Uncharacterized protein n=1 Tax=Arundo donax TaxID=35708 RepID=A0A0A9CLR1_ARUDO
MPLYTRFPLRTYLQNLIAYKNTPKWFIYATDNHVHCSLIRLLCTASLHLILISVIYVVHLLGALNLFDRMLFRENDTYIMQITAYCVCIVPCVTHVFLASML